MPFFRKTLSAPSPSCPPPSPNSSPSPSSFRSFLNDMETNGTKGTSCSNSPVEHRPPSPAQRRRLTRQRKLRHLTHEQLGLNSTGDAATPVRSVSQPGSPLDWSSSAVPQPLPLPEPHLTRRPESSVSHSGQPEPEPSPSAPTTSPPSRCAYSLLRVHIPARSAPTGGFSSPNMSPRRPGPSAPFCILSAPTSPSVSPDHSRSPRLRPQKNCGNQPLPVNAHPLPLPPPFQLPSPPAAVARHVSNKPGQWQKGRLIGRGTYGSVFHGTHRYGK